MNDLSPKARAVVDVGRNPGVFTHADQDRIKRGLMLRLATLGAATTTAGTAAAMSITTKIALLAAVTAVLGGGVASYWVLRGRAPAPVAVVRESSSSAPPVAVPLAMATPAADNAAPAPPLPTGAGPSDGVRRTARRPAAAGVPTTDDRAAAPALDSELSVLRRAREDLRTGAPGDAYQRLVDYNRHHGKGPLWQERQALSAIALCQWRPGPQAQARAAEFLRNAPQSPLADRVRSVCGSVNPAAR